jgi:hypothetical protein
VARHDEALTFNLPKSVMKFPCPGGRQMPDIMVEVAEPGDGPPLHRHPWASWDLVVSGAVRFRHGDETTDLGPGDLIHTPPNLPHTFMVIGDEPATTMGINWPGGFHRMYRELGELLGSSTDGRAEADMNDLAAVAARNDVDLLGPPLAILEAELAAG